MPEKEPKKEPDILSPDKTKKALRKLDVNALEKSKSVVVLGESFVIGKLQDYLIDHQDQFPEWRSKQMELTTFDKLRESAEGRDKKMFHMINEDKFANPRKAVTYLTNSGYSIDGAQKTYLAMLLLLRDFADRGEE